MPPKMRPFFCSAVISFVPKPYLRRVWSVECGEW